MLCKHKEVFTGCHEGLANGIRVLQFADGIQGRIKQKTVAGSEGCIGTEAKVTPTLSERTLEIATRPSAK